MAAADASFSTSIDATSWGATVFRSPGTPSTRTRGEVDALSVPNPRSRTSVPAAGSPLGVFTTRPAVRAGDGREPRRRPDAHLGADQRGAGHLVRNRSGYCADILGAGPFEWEQREQRHDDGAVHGRPPATAAREAQLVMGTIRRGRPNARRALIAAPDLGDASRSPYRAAGSPCGTRRRGHLIYQIASGVPLPVTQLTQRRLITR